MKFRLTLSAVVLCFTALYSAKTSMESVNPFNQFMAPSGGVNMYSGDVAYSLPITSVDGVSIALSYSSNIDRCVRARNDISPTGWVGLGWRLGFGSIMGDHKGTATHDDDDFYYLSPVGVSSKLHRAHRLFYKYYTSTVDLSAMPDFNNLPQSITFKSSGQCDNFDIGLRDYMYRIIFAFDGYINIPSQGDYTFYTSSDDGSMLYIDDNLIVDNDLPHGPQERSGTVTLSSGCHKIRVTYFQNDGEMLLEVRYSGGGIAKQLIPSEVLFLKAPDGREQLWYAENDPYTLFEPQDVNSDNIYEGWIVTGIDGTKMKYGNLDFSDAGERQATRNVMRFGDYVKAGIGSSPTPYPCQWDLSEIEDVSGNKTKYYYDTTLERCGDGYYTKASYLAKISTPAGNEIIFNLEPKEAGEWYDPYQFEPEPDKFMEVYDTSRLSSIVVKRAGAADADNTRLYRFFYTVIDAGNTGSKKSLLIHVEECQGTDTHVLGSTSMYYNTDLSKADNESFPDYHFGALTKVVNAKGGVVEFHYKRQNVSTGFNKRFLPPDNFNCGGIYPGTLSDGNEYVVLRGRKTTDQPFDCIYVYNWNGCTWEEKVSGLQVTNSNVQIKTSVDFFAFMINADARDVWIERWDGREWKMSMLRSSSSGKYWDMLYTGRDYIVLCGGDGPNTDDEICAFHYLHGQWVEQITDYDYGANACVKSVYAGPDYFVVKKAVFKGTSQLWVERWNGHDWQYYCVNTDESGHRAFAIVYPFADYFVAVGGVDDKDYANEVWVFRWNGDDTLREKLQIVGSPTQTKCVSGGQDYFVLEQDDRANGLWVYRWNGTSWESGYPLFSPYPINESCGLPVCGKDWFAGLSGNGTGLRVYNWNPEGWAWTKTIQADFPYPLNITAGNNFFVCCDSAIRTDLVPGQQFHPQINFYFYAWDGKEWNSGTDALFAPEVQAPETPRDPPGYWVITVGAVYGGTNTVLYNVAASANFSPIPDMLHLPIYMVYKIQDNAAPYDNVYTYVVDNKVLSNITATGMPAIVTDTFKFDNSNYDAATRTAKYNKVTTIVPDNGKTTQYFFNHTTADGQDQKADYDLLDGMVYRSNTFDKAHVEGDADTGATASSSTDYAVYQDSTWPVKVYVKQAVTSRSVADKVSTETSVWYNARNGQQKRTLKKNSDGRRLVAEQSFAFENSQDSAGMGPGGARMLVQPCQSISYEDDGFDYNDNSTHTVPMDMGSHTVIPIQFTSDQLSKIKMGCALTITFETSTGVWLLNTHAFCFLRVNGSDRYLGGVSVQDHYRIATFQYVTAEYPVTSLSLVLTNNPKTFYLRNLKINVANNYVNNVVSASATTYSNALNAGTGGTTWVPWSSYIWKVPLKADGTLAQGITFVPFDHTPSANNQNWYVTGIAERYNDFGAAVQTAKPATGGSLRTTTLYRSDLRLPMGSIAKAEFTKCGLFTCDYDMNEAGTPYPYFDKANGWEKDISKIQTGPAPSSVAVDNTLNHFGEATVRVVNCYGVRRAWALEQGADYVVSAWVKCNSSMLREKGFLIDVYYRKVTGPGWPLSIDYSSAISCNGTLTVTGSADGWQLVKLSVPASTDISSPNWEAGYKYAEVWIGAPHGDGQSPAGDGIVNMDDIRIFRKGAKVSSTYLISKWQQPIVSVDANNNPGKKTRYDDFGRPIKSYKVNKYTSDTTLVKEQKYHYMLSDSLFYENFENGNSIIPSGNWVLGNPGYNNSSYCVKWSVPANHPVWFGPPLSVADSMAGKTGFLSWNYKFASGNYQVLVRYRDGSAGHILKAINLTGTGNWEFVSVPYDFTAVSQIDSVKIQIIFRSNIDTCKIDNFRITGLSQPPTSGSPEQFPDTGKWYKIVSKCRATTAPDSEYGIDIVNWDCDNPGQYIHLYQYYATRNQQWKFEADGGFFHIKTRCGTLGLVIEDPYHDITNGKQLGIYYAGDNWQKWTLHDDGDGYFKIKAYYGTTAVIDVNDSSVYNGDKLQIWNLGSLDETHSKDKWQIIEVP